MVHDIQGCVHAGSWMCSSHDIDSMTDSLPRSTLQVPYAHARAAVNDLIHPKEHVRSIMSLSKDKAVSIGVYVYKRAQVCAGYIQSFILDRAVAEV
jgi:hypothetical protein